MKNLLLAATLCAAFSACISDNGTAARQVFRVEMDGMTEPLAVRVSESEWSYLGFGLMESNLDTEGIGVFGGGFMFAAMRDSSQVRKGNIVLASYAGMPCKFSDPEGFQFLEGDSIPLVLRPVHYSHAMDRINLGLIIDSAASEKRDARVDLAGRALVFLSMQVACP